MKKFSAAGFTVASVLGIALLGGVTGGALVLGDDGSQAEARPVQVGLKVADEAPTVATETVTPEPTMELTPTPALEPGSSAPAPVQEEPVTSTKTETAKEAADRAEKAAQRAESAAEKAEATTAPAPRPVPTPIPAPDPMPVSTPAPACGDGDVRNLAQTNEQVCSGGKWVSASPNRHCALVIDGDRKVYATGDRWNGETTETRPGRDAEGIYQSTTYYYTYECQDGYVATVEKRTVRNR